MVLAARVLLGTASVPSWTKRMCHPIGKPWDKAMTIDSRRLAVRIRVVAYHHTQGATGGPMGCQCACYSYGVARSSFLSDGLKVIRIHSALQLPCSWTVPACLLNDNMALR